MSLLEKISNLIGIETAQAFLPNLTRFHSWQDILTGVIEYLLSFVGILSVIAIMYSGIMYITASGDSSKAQAAKKNLTWAVIGLAAVILSIVAVEEINNILAGKYK